MKTILAPVDFSKVSESVVKEAATLARAFDGRIVLLTVVQPPVIVTEYAGVLDWTQIAIAGERNAARQLEAFESKLKNQFIKTESVQVTGAPVAMIIDQAEKNEADYIVMGSHGHTAFYDLLVGSTTHGVLTRAKCPVVIVPATPARPSPRKKHQRALAV
jgi:nucleotide-binding universal stress UspA family protein